MYVSMHVCIHICTYLYTHVITINKKETKNLKENKEGHMRRFGRSKEKREML